MDPEKRAKLFVMLRDNLEAQRHVWHLLTYDQSEKSTTP